MTKMDEASNPCGGDIEAEMCQLMREQPPAEGVVDRVALQRHRNVALITLSHPQAQNALNLASWRRLKRLLDDLAGESGLRAVVLRGAGDKAFAAGADIKEFPTPA
ncbi:enoyl-CoA hydratase/isomerase family protein [Mycobacterium tuberculosis]|uniref:enoyl-CoA hydratase/isomerase family protein n=1 Tax=Mycobacterium tuberculosis TaxID=1773 RepID=UPI000A862236|nr:enoyl-CoA hydratase/isomerase family protein [Mycobacterium tuberculosis]